MVLVWGSKRWVYVCCLYSAPMYKRGVLLTMPLPPQGIYYKAMLSLWQEPVPLIVVVYTYGIEHIY